jgi:prevent-host-death family protein
MSAVKPKSPAVKPKIAATKIPAMTVATRAESSKALRKKHDSGARVTPSEKLFVPFALTPENVMPSVAATRLRQSGSEVVNHVAFKDEDVVITRNGKAVAIMVPIATYERLCELEDASDLALALRAEAEFIEGGEKAIPIAEARKRLGL